MNLIKEYIQTAQAQKVKVRDYHENANKDDIIPVGHLKDLELMVYPNEQEKTPHFHFVNTKTGEKGAIKIMTAEYCFHNGYTATLNKDQLKEIYEWFCYPAFKNSKDINYDYLCEFWLMANENTFIERPKDIPNYTQL